MEIVQKKSFFLYINSYLRILTVILVTIVLGLIFSKIHTGDFEQTKAADEINYNLQPTNDTYVSSGYPDSASGGSNVSLNTSNYSSTNIRRTFLKFDLAPFSGQSLVQAQLKLTPDLARTVEKQVKLVSDTSWLESTLTWNSQPPMGSVIGTLPTQATSVGVPVVITLDASQLQALIGSVLSLGLDNTSTNSSTFSVSSKEVVSGKPELILTIGGGTPTASPTLTPTPTPSVEPTPTVTPSPTATPSPSPSPGSGVVLVGAGDIASCSSTGDEKTASLLDSIPGIVFTTGDNVYENGTLTEFNNCYNPSWGRHKSRTNPSSGNHEYNTANASGYYSYFGLSAGDPTKGYYSYDYGLWHIVVINSNCSKVGGCNAGSPQEQWLRADLAANPTACTLAYWHHPLFSSSGSSSTMKPIWQALYDYDADIVLAGHRHNYERFAPQNSSGTLDLSRGIREFVVGTGGRSHHSFGSIKANSEVRNNDTYGVLKLTLNSSSYDWQFIPEAGKIFTDTGSANCH